MRSTRRKPSFEMNQPSTASVPISTICPTVIAAGALALVNPTVSSQLAVRMK